MDNLSIREFCKKLLKQNFFFQVEDGAMLRNMEFKEHKVVTGNFTINLKEKDQIGIKELYPACSYFVSGISLEVELPSTVTEYAGEEPSKDQ